LPADREQELTRPAILPANPIHLLREPTALKLWIAGLGMNAMRWLELLAYALFALELTGSPFWVAMMTFARIMPLLFAALIATWVERLPRRAVLIGLFLALTGVNLVVLGLVLVGLLSIGHLLAAAFISGVAWTLENPVRRTMLADSVGHDRLNAIMGLDVASNQLTRGLGPAVGGIVVEGIGLVGVFGLGVVLNLGVTWLLVTIPKAPIPAERPTPPPFWRTLKEGIAYVRGHPLLPGVLAVTAIFNLWAFPYVSLAPVIGERVLKLSPTAIGFLLATEAMGGLAGAILIAMFARPQHSARIYSFGAVLFMCGTLTFGIVEVPALAFLVLFAAGFGIAGFNAMQMTIPLHATPPEMRVRVMGLVTLFIGSSLIGFLHAGWLAEWLGGAAAQKLIAIEGLIAMAFALRRWPSLHRAEAPAPPATRPAA